MKMRKLLSPVFGLCGLALVASPAMSADPVSEVPTNAPSTGAEGTPTGTSGANTAIPEVPAGGTTTGTPVKDSGGSPMDLQQSLSAKGYTGIMPAASAGIPNSDETHFTAIKGGKKVNLTVNSDTGVIVKETPVH